MYDTHMSVRLHHFQNATTMAKQSLEVALNIWTIRFTSYVSGSLQITMLLECTMKNILTIKMIPEVVKYDMHVPRNMKS